MKRKTSLPALRSFVLLFSAIFLVLCLNLQAQAPTPESPQLLQGTAKTLTRPDLALHYKDFGQGEPVLILPGGPGFNMEMMEPVARMIAKRGRAILLDQRGSGLSMPKENSAITLAGTLADFEALRNDLGLAQWTVLGCSWGGMVAMDYAAKYSGSLKAIVLLDSGGTSWASFRQAFEDNIFCRMTPDERTAFEYWSKDEVRKTDPLRAEIEAMRCFFPAYFYDRTKALPVIASLKVGKEYYNSAANCLVDEYEKGATARVEALGKADIPALIVHGRQDPMPESVALANQALLKGSRLVWLDRCGHFAWVEQPEALEKALFEFLLK